jgi:serine/threonine-protein kinase SRPK3
MFELLTGDQLFEPQGATSYSRDDDHIAQIIELLGERSFSRQFALSGAYSNRSFNNKGTRRSLSVANGWKLSDRGPLE